MSDGFAERLVEGLKAHAELIVDKGFAEGMDTLRVLLEPLEYVIAQTRDDVRRKRLITSYERTRETIDSFKE